MQYVDLRTRYSELTTLTSQYIKFITETLRRLEEEEVRSGPWEEKGWGASMPPLHPLCTRDCSEPSAFGIAATSPPLRLPAGGVLSCQEDSPPRASRGGLLVCRGTSQIHVAQLGLHQPGAPPPPRFLALLLLCSPRTELLWSLSDSRFLPWQSSRFAGAVSGGMFVLGGSAGGLEARGPGVAAPGTPLHVWPLCPPYSPFLCALWGGAWWHGRVGGGASLGRRWGQRGGREGESPSRRKHRLFCSLCQPATRLPPCPRSFPRPGFVASVWCALSTLPCSQGASLGPSQR